MIYRKWKDELLELCSQLAQEQESQEQEYEVKRRRRPAYHRSRSINRPIHPRRLRMPGWTGSISGSPRSKNYRSYRRRPPTEASSHSQSNHYPATADDRPLAIASASSSGGVPADTVLHPSQSQPQGTEYIRWVQYALNRIMNLHLPVSGIMEPETRSALRRFQNQTGLPVTGFVDPYSEKKLVEALGKLDWKKNLQKELDEILSIELDPDLEEENEEVNRSSRDYIRWVQRALNRIMGLRLSCDGVAGPRTRMAIRVFQRSNGLTPDGIVGPKTERTLISRGAGSPPFEIARPVSATSPKASRPEWLEWIPSPYHSGRGKQPVTAIIYHYTAGPNLNGTVRWFQNNPKKVSAHYVVGKDGRIVQMVPLSRSAHHAGASRLPGCRRGVNACSVGIEIVNWGMLTRRGKKFYTHNGRIYKGPKPVFARGRWWEPYSSTQRTALIRLTRYLLTLYPDIAFITGHEDIAPGRKSDPGGAFDWPSIRAGLGNLYPGHIGPLANNLRREVVQDMELSEMVGETTLFPEFNFDDGIDWHAPSEVV